MTVQRVAISLVVGVGLLTLLVVSIISQLTLRDVRAEKDKWENERATLEAGLSEALGRAAAGEAAAAAREKELLGTIQRQTDERHALTDAVEKGKAELETLRARVAELEAGVAAVTGERDALAAEKTTLAAELETTKTELADRVADEARYQAALDALKPLIESLATRMGEAEKALLAKLGELEAAQKANTSLADEIARLTQALAHATERLDRVDAVARELAKEGTGTGDSGATGTQGAPPPVPAPAVPIQAVVAAVNDADGLVVISAGTKKGVLAGMTFTVFDESDEKLATLRASDVYDDYTGCVVTWKREGAVLARPQKVSTSDKPAKPRAASGAPAVGGKG